MKALPHHKVSLTMPIQLSAGALGQICQGEEVGEPVLQVLGHKAIQVIVTESERIG